MRASTSFLILAVTLPAALTGCAVSTPTVGTEIAAGPEIAVPEAVSPEPIEVLVAGDSLASGGPWDAMQKDPGSWTYFLDERIQVSGGWRRDGATTELIAERIPFERADALVVMAGTNDVRQERSPEDLVDDVETIGDAVDVGTVLIAAIPPQSEHAAAVATVNLRLTALAERRGWTWLDPWALYRAGDDWAESGSPDGVHGSVESYRAAAGRISEAIVRAVEPREVTGS